MKYKYFLIFILTIALGFSCKKSDVSNESDTYFITYKIIGTSDIYNINYKDFDNFIVGTRTNSGYWIRDFEINNTFDAELSVISNHEGSVELFIYINDNEVAYTKNSETLQNVNLTYRHVSKK